MYTAMAPGNRRLVSDNKGVRKVHTLMTGVDDLIGIRSRAVAPFETDNVSWNNLDGVWRRNLPKYVADEIGRCDILHGPARCPRV
jgi:hypothetical protein